MESNAKTLPIIVASVIISALITGGGVYAYQKAIQEKKTDDLQQQIDTLAQRIQKTPTASVETSPSPSASAPTSTLTTYSNSKYGFSFAYPKSWNIKESSYDGGNLTITLNEKAAVDGTDKPADLSLSVTQYIKPLGTPDKFDSLENWVKDPNNLSFKNAKATTVGGRSGFSADAGTDTFGGGKFYFATQKDKSVIELRDVAQNGTTKAIMDSLKLAQ